MKMNFVDRLLAGPAALRWALGATGLLAVFVVMIGSAKPVSADDLAPRGNAEDWILDFEAPMSLPHSNNPSGVGIERASCGGCTPGSVIPDGWGYFTVTRNGATIAQSTPQNLYNIETGVQVPSLQRGDVVSVFAKDETTAKTGSAPPQPVPGPYSQMFSVANEMPTVTGSTCGYHPSVIGTMRPDTNYAFVQWAGSTTPSDFASLSGSTFTASDPASQTNMTGQPAQYCAQSVWVTGISYLNTAGGVVMLRQFAPRFDLKRVAAKKTPAARCDAYWTKPKSVLTVAAPGVLKNDKSNGNGRLSAHVVRISFGAHTHPYYVRSNGAVRFKATKSGTATITYHDIGANGRLSRTTKARIYIARTKPRKLLARCPGSAKSKSRPS